MSRASNAAILIIALTLLLACLIARVQADTTFAPTDKFGILSNNSTISFSMGGSYVRASLENATWSFVGLMFNYSQQPLNLGVSAQDSNVIITSYRTFNTTFRGVLLRYRVEGQGKQTFYIGVLKGGEWSVSFNGVFIGENDSWSVSRDGTVMVTGAASHSNVTIAYYTFLDSFEDNSNLPFYQQHSVAIITAVAVAIAVVLAVAIRKKVFSTKTLS